MPVHVSPYFGDVLGVVTFPELSTVLRQQYSSSNSPSLPPSFSLMASTDTRHITPTLLIVIHSTVRFSGVLYWHQTADERHGNPPQGNQELSVVRDKVGRPSGELGVSKSMECGIYYFPFSALTLLVG